jgi:hypothetical protein
MKKSIVMLFFALCFLVFSTKISAATTVTSFTPGPASIGKYQKYEATFDISRKFAVLPDFAYPDKYDQAKDAMLPYYYYDASDNHTTFPNRKSPYGADGITINAIIVSPTQKQLTLPAFYYQNYSRSGDQMSPEAEYVWKIRFTPEELGKYTYSITIQDKFGETTYSTNALTFESVSSSNNGFINVSTTDSRYFEFSNGKSFIPLSHGGQWYKNPQSSRVTGFESAFDSWKLNGINFTRLWDQNDGYSLTTEGHFDGYQDGSTENWYDNRPPPDNYNAIPSRGEKYNPDNLAKGTQINQRGAFEKDLIFDSAEKNSVYIQLCSHEDPYWIWDHDMHTDTNKLTDIEHLNYWRRNYRYRIARWGYSTSLFGWEAVNEHYISGSDPTKQDFYGFYTQWAQFVKQNDPHNHMVTTSNGSGSNYTRLWTDPAIGMDYGNSHDYALSKYGSLRNDEARYIYSQASCLVSNYDCSNWGLSEYEPWTGPRKPWVWGEFDIAHSSEALQWTQPDPKIIDGEARIRMLHNTTWAGLFSPMGVSPLDWYWDRQTQEQTELDRLSDRKATSQFFSGIDFSHANFVHLMTPNDAPSGYSGETIGSSNPQARVYGMRRADKKAAYLWIQHRDYTWSNSPAEPAAISPTITIGNLLAEAYTVEFWNTHTTTSQKYQTQTMTPVNGSLSLSVGQITTDMAVKIVSTNGSSPSVSFAQGFLNWFIGFLQNFSGVDFVTWRKNIN